MSWGPSPLSSTPSSSYNEFSRLALISAWLTGNQYDNLQNIMQRRSSTTTGFRRNTNIISTSHSGTKALATASVDASHRQLGIHRILECAFLMGHYGPHPIISLSTKTSMETSLTLIVSNRSLRPVSKLSIFSLENQTYPSDSPPSCLTN